MPKKDHWLPDYCKPYIKNTAEAYTLLEKKRAFICTLKTDGCCNCFSCWERNTPEGQAPDTWERRIRWITTDNIVHGYLSPCLKKLSSVLTTKGLKWAESYWLKEPNPLEWALRPWDDWINPKLARYENRDTRTLEELASSTPPDVESVTLPKEAWHMWQHVVLKPDCRKAEAVFRMKCLVLAGVLAEDFAEQDLRAFVEEEDEEPHWHKGVQRNLYRIIEESGSWLRWEAKAPDPETQILHQMKQGNPTKSKAHSEKKSVLNTKGIRITSWDSLSIGVKFEGDGHDFVTIKAKTVEEGGWKTILKDTKLKDWRRLGVLAGMQVYKKKHSIKPELDGWSTSMCRLNKEFRKAFKINTPPLYTPRNSGEVHWRFFKFGILTPDEKYKEFNLTPEEIKKILDRMRAEER